MASRDEIVRFLNELLEIDKFKDKILNGLEIEGKGEVKKIVFGVSHSLELFEKAAQEKADMIILHHGLISDFQEKAITGLMKKRIKTLLDNDINLLAYHLPLDAHYDSGNNAQLMKLLGLEFREMFDKYEGMDIGVIGTYSKPKPVEDVVKILNKNLNTNSRLIKFKDTASVVAIVSGGGGSSVLEAIQKGADLFITGDSMEHMFALAKEARISLIFAGHYNSEKLGIQALADLIKNKFKVQTKFIDIPCEL
ncbi:Nif3-like dinuclear metal center hexameric protein [Candidatus Woesearchaeota archaeon]|nr:Nif3-like dinuclear metal center hexameric protein [Candidatus Woesearchaeota archaeon]MBW3022352.1 Nif3-like dinuclear metal center hexameric protein [Candidatus Woesearchaeota archaeon]